MPDYDNITYEQGWNMIDRAVQNGTLNAEEGEIRKSLLYRNIVERDAAKANMNLMNEQLSPKTKSLNDSYTSLSNGQITEEVKANSQIPHYIDNMFFANTFTKEMPDGSHEMYRTIEMGDRYKKAVKQEMIRLGYNLADFNINETDKGFELPKNTKAILAFSKAYDNVDNEMGTWTKMFSNTADTFGKKVLEIGSGMSSPTVNGVYKTNQKELVSDHTLMKAINKDYVNLYNKANAALNIEGFNTEQTGSITAIFEQSLGEQEVMTKYAQGAYKTDTEYKNALDEARRQIYDWIRITSVDSYDMYAYEGDDASDIIGNKNPNDKKRYLDNLTKVESGTEKRKIQDYMISDIDAIDYENNKSNVSVSFAQANGMYGHILTFDKNDKHQGFKIFIPYSDSNKVKSPEKGRVCVYASKPSSMAASDISILTNQNNTKIQRAMTAGNNVLSGTYQYYGADGNGEQYYKYNFGSNSESVLLNRPQLQRLLTFMYQFDQNANVYAMLKKKYGEYMPDGRKIDDMYYDNMNSDDDLDIISVLTGITRSSLEWDLERDYKSR